MSRRKLAALNYHLKEDFKPEEEPQFRNLVLWLEDQVIRHYKIETREGLRDVKSPKWNEAFDDYCKDLGAPTKLENKIDRLEWILGFAVRLAYGDQLEKKEGELENVSAEKVRNIKTDVPVVKSTNPLDNMDFSSEEFRNGVNNLAKLLKVPAHPDHLVTLQAIASVILKAMEGKKEPVQGTPFPIMEADLGFDMGDYVLNQAAKILRLLYIHDLRDLQTRINECIVTVQSITADPKTDSSLGKVGF